jgi:mutator protein MutT
MRTGPEYGPRQEPMKSKPHFHVTAGLIWSDGRVLLTRRPHGKHLAGYWEFPGGKQEQGESLEACLEREILEELGVRVKVNEKLFQVDHEYDEKSISLHLFHCSRLVGEPQTIGCDAMEWVNPQDLDLYELPPPDIRIISFIKSLTERMG